MEKIKPTPILFLEENSGNRIYVMRDDLIPFSFGGNKVRKAVLFFQEIDQGTYDTVVTYGSGASNHCRVIANMAAARNMKCVVISTDKACSGMNRHLIVERFGAQVITCETEKVAKTIDETLRQLKEAGKSPFFIPGGGHGNTGTKAYDLAYDEIVRYSEETNTAFDYIFLASGTGTTQAGLICGKMRHEVRDQKIVGISIARKNPRGRQVIAESVKDYIGAEPGEHLLFEDGYICGGYGCRDAVVDQTIQRIMVQHGLPLDPVYTGKAYTGMERYLAENGVTGANVLFIHTGGTPIFCDWVREV